MPVHPRAENPRGQTIVILAVGMVVLIGMVGLIIDVGLQWGANRGAQNGSDAAAEAGAIVLMEYMLGASKDDADVRSAVDAVAAANEIELDTVEYTTWQGVPLDVDVGSGSIPLNAQGVRVVGTRLHETVFARVLGVTELSVFTDAVAVSGPSEPCPPDTACPLIPITIPTTIVTCDGQNKSVPTEDQWVGPPDAPEYIIPLCGDNPGSVGWIDWSPPSGGISELAAEICDPGEVINLPDWYYVTSTGNTNSNSVQDCFDQWVGKEIMFPLFEDTCASDPGEATECTDPAPIGGVNQWYYFPRAASLRLTGIYIQGDNSDVCDPSGGSGATTCLTGTFIDTSIVGEVGAWGGDDGSLSHFFSVQLIR
jgi:hypothetical protein